jgi:hypothetical protein
MGIGMQIVCLGCAHSRSIEAEASVQLVRLERFSAQISGCHLELEMLCDLTGNIVYRARLQLIACARGRMPVSHHTAGNVEDVLRKAFDSAERHLARKRTVPRA